MNELKIFEGQEVKITTNEGKTIINLVHVAKCCGLVNKTRGYESVRWTQVKDRLEVIKAIGKDMPTQNKEEISYILEEIENSDDRNQIYMSSWLSKRLALECHSEKAMRFKNFLVSLDEERENNQLTVSQTTQVQAAQLLQVVTAGLHEFVKDSIRVKDSQIEAMADMVGLRARNTKSLTGKLKEELFKAYKRTIPASHYLYTKAKSKVFREFGVTKWEEIPVGKYNAVFAYIENMEF
ncbi:MAG: hypothetical protein ACRDA4_10720 [Filifactoraceae bacterium]